jgi:large subunit ribosomal protein L13
MLKLTQQTVSVRKEDVQRKWYIVDADGETIGRISTKIASVLRGKHKPTYTPHVDTGDYVIIINADKARFTGNKMAQKVYLTYSLHPGGQKSILAKDLLVKKPIKIMEEAVKGMLPKNKLGRAMYKKLFVYAGAEHPHSAQKPEPLV